MVSKVGRSWILHGQNNLGLCYEVGKGVAVDLKKAFYWYQKSADSTIWVSIRRMERESGSILKKYSFCTKSLQKLDFQPLNSISVGVTKKVEMLKLIQKKQYIGIRGLLTVEM